METGASASLPSHRPLAGKTAIVTGASGGIGQAIAHKLASLGCAVAVHYRSRPESAAHVAAQCAAQGVSAIAMAADLTQSDQVNALFTRAEKELGGIDIVVANAGVPSVRSAVADITDEQFESVIAGNVRATFHVLRAAARTVRQGGRIVAIGSSTTIYPGPGFGAYAASKTPVMTLTRILAAELAARGVTVNTVVAGATDAGFLDRYSAAAKQRLAAFSPFGRLGTADDIADIVAFMATHEARWLSGQTLVANGAATI